jgi:tRNA pseudouridine32 synthase / 23S rRNA pseudouridine746 synthase
MAAACSLRLLLETPRLLVVDKPRGLSFHADETGAGGVLAVAREAQETGDLPGGRLYAVHRLDRVTSGCLVLARDAQSAGLLGRELRTHGLQKWYVALSARRPSKKMGAVVGDMLPARRGAWKLTRTSNDPARTLFVSSGVPGARSGLRGFVLRPLTGRTHQLRVAMKSLGAPVLGDELYADAVEARRESRAYLHACALHIPALEPGELPVAVLCPPPQEGEFGTPEFASWFASYFPKEGDAASWCSDIAPSLMLRECDDDI